jgi:uncharacterized protein with GYD domain
MKYLVTGTYTPEGVKGLISKGGTSRVAAVTAMVENLGGKIEAFYYAFGKTDVIVIVDVPDAITGAALSLAVNSSGAVELSTTPLMTPEEIDQACQKSIDYVPPGN